MPAYPSPPDELQQALQLVSRSTGIPAAELEQKLAAFRQSEDPAAKALIAGLLADPKRLAALARLPMVQKLLHDYEGSARHE